MENNERICHGCRHDMSNMLCMNKIRFWKYKPLVNRNPWCWEVKE